MNYLLISGAPSTGKTETVYDIAHHLVTNLGYNQTTGHFPTPKPTPPARMDFTCILEGIGNGGSAKKVLLNSPSDLPGNADHLKEWIDTSPGVNLIITSIRDGGDDMRDYLWNTIGINPAVDTIIELPLAKITRINHFPTALTWYKTTMLAHIISLLRRVPLDL